MADARLSQWDLLMGDGDPWDRPVAEVEDTPPPKSQRTILSMTDTLPGVIQTVTANFSMDVAMAESQRAVLGTRLSPSVMADIESHIARETAAHRVTPADWDRAFRMPWPAEEQQTSPEPEYSAYLRPPLIELPPAGSGIGQAMLIRLHSGQEVRFTLLRMGLTIDGQTLMWDAWQPDGYTTEVALPAK